MFFQFSNWQGHGLCRILHWGLYNLLANSRNFVFYNYYIIIYVTKKTIIIYYCVFRIHLISIHCFILRKKKSVLLAIFLVLKNSIVSIWSVIFLSSFQSYFYHHFTSFFFLNVDLAIEFLTCHTVKLLACIY